MSNIVRILDEMTAIMQMILDLLEATQQAEPSPRRRVWATYEGDHVWTVHAAGEWYRPWLYEDTRNHHSMHDDGKHGDNLPDDRVWAVSALRDPTGWVVIDARGHSMVVR